MKKRAVMALAVLMISAVMTITANAGSWEDQNGRWKYKGDDGSYAVSQWIEDNVNWYYVDAEGFMKTGWFEDGGKWYYLDSTGAMVKNTTWMIDGVSYRFDASGAWIEEGTAHEGGPGMEEAKQPDDQGRSSAMGQWSGSTFINRSMDYQITFPDGYLNAESIIDEMSGGLLDFSACAPDSTVLFAGAVYEDVGDALAVEDLALLTAIMMLASGDYEVADEMTTVSLGGYDYVKLPLIYEEVFVENLYFRKVGQNIMMLEVVYEPGHAAAADAVLATMKKINS